MTYKELCRQFPTDSEQQQWARAHLRKRNGGHIRDDEEVIGWITADKTEDAQIVGAWIGRRDYQAAPPPSPAVVLPFLQRASWFADDAAWTDLVQRQGVVLTFDDLSEYYQTYHWQVLRDAWRTGRCSSCKADGPTDLHHLTYARLGYERPEDVAELCRACHAKRHEGWRNLKRAA